MKFIPILFSTPMVEAILAGRKTQTRRIVKPQPTKQEAVEIFCKEGPGSVNSFDLTQADIEIDELFDKCPYGQPGDILWVRETFQYVDFAGDDNGYVYKATDPDWSTMEGWKWKPSLFMPKEACRIFLKVKSVRVERLQDISDKDAIAEGVLLHEKGIHYLNYFDAHHKVTQFIYNCRSAVESFKYLWILINGKRDEPFGWFRNPLVWVIEFERVELTEEQKQQFLNN